MLTLSQILAFLIAAIVLTISPGPDNLMVLGISLSKGRRQGIIFGLGCALGCLSHTLMAVVGISVLIVSSPKAFAIMKFIGGAYLFYLGIQTFLNQKYITTNNQQSLRGISISTTFVRGLLASSLNPKVALFFVSFLPQFVIADQGNVTLQLTVLSGIFILQAIFIFSLVGYFSGSIGDVLRCNPKMNLWLDRISGGILVLLGIRIWVTS